MTDNDLQPRVQKLLDLYRQHPHTTGRVRKADRSLAEQLCRQGVALDTIDAALVLVAARRSMNPRLIQQPIRSLHYFLPAIRELLEQPLDSGYLCYLRDSYQPHSPDSTID